MANVKSVGAKSNIPMKSFVMVKQATWQFHAVLHVTVGNQRNPLHDHIAGVGRVHNYLLALQEWATAQQCLLVSIEE